MANRVTLDFETGMVTWDTDSQQGTEFCPDLAARQPAILAAMGYGTVDLSSEVNAINAFINGRISEAELLQQLDPVPLTPSYHGEKCQGNGQHEGIECQCDECDHYQECFPDWREL